MLFICISKQLTDMAQEKTTKLFDFNLGAIL